MRPIDADAIYKILESCEIKKDTYGSLLNDWDHGYNCGIERAESEIECAPTVDAVPVEWIPVSEQMPEEFKTVLVFALSDDGDHGFMTTASHEGRGIWYDECFYQPLPKVYAWMPLPEPYEVKE